MHFAQLVKQASIAMISKQILCFTLARSGLAPECVCVCCAGIMGMAHI